MQCHGWARLIGWLHQIRKKLELEWLPDEKTIGAIRTFVRPWTPRAVCIYHRRRAVCGGWKNFRWGSRGRMSCRDVISRGLPVLGSAKREPRARCELAHPDWYGYPSARSLDPHATRRKTWHCDITGASDLNRRLRGDPSRDRVGRAAHKADQHPERRRVVMELGSWWSCSKQRRVVLRLVEQRLKPRVAGGSRFWHS